MMKQQLMSSLATFTDFSLYLATAFLMTWLFVVIYVRVTPYRELELIRNGNRAAALSLGGAILGFTAALASVIAHSVGYLDLMVWSGVAALTQMMAYAAVRLLIGDIARGIEEGCMANGAFLGICSFATGLLTAACMTT